MAVSPMSPPSASLEPTASAVRDRLLAELALGDASTLKRELHDTVLQDVLYIAMELTRLEEGQSQEDPAGLAKVARETYRRFREVLDNGSATDASSKTMRQLVNRQREWFKKRTGREIDVTWKADGKNIVLSRHTSHNLGRILHEALWNAWVHADAREIALTVERAGDGFAVSIRDDGEGFAPDDIPESHYGLANMAERAELIGAQFSVESARGIGTTVRLVFSGSDTNHGGAQCRSQLSLSTIIA